MTGTNSKSPPKFSMDGNMDDYFMRLDMWCDVTDIKAEKQGQWIVLHLPDDEEGGDGGGDLDQAGEPGRVLR